jgi:hypothetical protein
MSSDIITDPISGNEYSIFSSKGHKLLKSYVSIIMSGGARKSQRKSQSKPNKGGNPRGRQGTGKTYERLVNTSRTSKQNKQGLKTRSVISKQTKQTNINARRHAKLEYLTRKAKKVTDNYSEELTMPLNAIFDDYFEYLTRNPEILTDMVNSGAQPAPATTAEADMNDTIDEIHYNIKMANLETNATPTKILSSLSKFVFDDTLSKIDRLGMMMMMLRLLQYVWVMLGENTDPRHGLMFDSYTAYTNTYIDRVDKEVEANLITAATKRLDVFTTAKGKTFKGHAYGSMIPERLIKPVQEWIDQRTYANQIKTSIFVVSALLMGLFHVHI